MGTHHLLKELGQHLTLETRSVYQVFEIGLFRKVCVLTPVSYTHPHTRTLHAPHPTQK